MRGGTDRGRDHQDQLRAGGSPPATRPMRADRGERQLPRRASRARPVRSPGRHSSGRHGGHPLGEEARCCSTGVERRECGVLALVGAGRRADGAGTCARDDLLPAAGVYTSVPAQRSRARSGSTDPVRRLERRSPLSAAVTKLETQIGGEPARRPARRRGRSVERGAVRATPDRDPGTCPASTNRQPVVMRASMPDHRSPGGERRAQASCSGLDTEVPDGAQP